MKIAPSSAPSRRLSSPSPGPLPRRPVTPPSARSIFTAERAAALAARLAPPRAAPSRVAAQSPPPLAPPAAAPEPSPPPGFHDAVSAFKRQLIESTLTALGGNRTRTARALKLQRTYLLRLMREFSVDVPAPSIAPRRATPAAAAPSEPRGR